MTDLPLSVTDIIVLAILAISALFAFFRGFVKEVLSIMGWVGAALVAIWGFPYARPLARNLIPYPEIADVATGAVLFIVALVVFGLIAHVIAAQVKESAVSGLDRALGFLFGVARGGVIVSLGFIAAQWVWGANDMPDWLVKARTEPAMRQGAEWLMLLAPPDIREKAGFVADEATRKAEQARQAQQLYQNLTAPTPIPQAQQGNVGQAEPAAPAYDDKSRGSLDKLIQEEQKQTQ